MPSLFWVETLSADEQRTTDPGTRYLHRVGSYATPCTVPRAGIEKICPGKGVFFNIRVPVPGRKSMHTRVGIPTGGIPAAGSEGKGETL
eukprot:757792-Rhodomonas_salina.1